MKNSSVVEICARPPEAVSWRGSQIAISTFDFEAAALVGEEERARPRPRPVLASTCSSLTSSSLSGDAGLFTTENLLGLELELA